MVKWIAVSAFVFAISGCGSSTNNNTGGGSIPAGTTTFNVTAPNAPSSYSINGVSNPSITLQAGQTYTFNVSASGHPFWINSTQGTGTGNAYNSGVTNNGTESGTITFQVPSTGAPGTLFYDCQFHSGMTGTITVTN